MRGPAGRDGAHFSGVVRTRQHAGGGSAAAAAEHRRHHGRRHRHLEHRRLPPRHDGGPHAEPRQDRRRGHAVHRLLRRGELHGGPRQLHHRRAADPHRHDHRRPGRRADRPAGRGRDHRHRAQGRWATPPASSARTTSATRTSSCRRCTASTSSSATSITSTRWKTRAIRTTRRTCWTQVGPRNMVHSWATDDDDATVDPRWGKVGKQKIEDAGELCPEAHGDRGRRDPRPGAEVHRQGQGRQQAVLPLAQSDPHAHRHAPVAEVPGDAQLARTAGPSTKPAWRSSTTTSAS